MKTNDLVPRKAFPSITQEMLLAYSQVSGDPNPIHLDDAVAKKAGLPGVIAHGMLIASFMAERAREFVSSSEEADHLKLGKFRIRFKNMTFLGETILVGGQVRSSNDREVILDLEAKAEQTGDVKATAQVSLSRQDFPNR